MIPRFGGINRLDPPHLIRDDEAQILEDGRLDRNRLEARLYRLDYGPPVDADTDPRTTWIHPVRYFSKLKGSSAVIRDVAVMNGVIYRDYTSVITGVSKDDRWSGFIYGGRLYLASSGAMYVITPTGSNTWGIAAPTSAITTAAGAAGNLNGEYVYKCTFYNADGIESDSYDASTSLSVEDEKIDLSAIPTSSDSQVTGRYIYRQGGLVSTYNRVKDLSDNTTTTYTDNMLDADAAAATQKDTSTHDEPASMPIVVLHDGRAYFAGNTTYPNRLYYSDSLYPEYAGNYRTIGGYESLVALSVWENELFIFKQGEIFSLAGSAPGTAKIRQLAVKRGTIARNSVATGKFPTYIYWDGIYTHDGYVDSPVGRKLYEIFKSEVNTDRLSGAVATATRQFYIASVPEKGKSENSLTIVYDYETRDVYVQEFGATSLWTGEDGVIYAGMEDGSIHALEHTFPSVSENIKLKWRSKKFHLGPNMDRIGSLKDITFTADTKGEDVQLHCYIDGRHYECGTFSCDGVEVQHMNLPSKDGFFVEIELRYTGTERPEFYSPVIINPDGEVQQ